jgi:heme exporter protein D
MIMDTVLQWVNMGGYALYVWTAYGVAFLVLAMQFISVSRHKKNTEKKLTTWFNGSSS